MARVAVHHALFFSLYSVLTGALCSASQGGLCVRPPKPASIADRCYLCADVLLNRAAKEEEEADEKEEGDKMDVDKEDDGDAEPEEEGAKEEEEKEPAAK